MSHFTADWLALREPADHAARAAPAALRLGRHFAAAARARAKGCVRLGDLAGGTGSNMRFLVPLVGVSQSWTIIDHDPVLLDRLGAACHDWAECLGWRPAVPDGLCFEKAGRRLHIIRAERNVAAPVALQGFDGITAAALLDLVSDAWLTTFCAGLSRAGRPPVLFSLVFDGRIDWSPPLADDAWIRGLFQQDMRTDKGFGPALGGTAPAIAAERLGGIGYRVEQARSPWVIGPRQLAMQEAMLNFLCDAVAARAAVDMGRLADWCDARAALRGSQTLRVGHTEVLGSR